MQQQTLSSFLVSKTPAASTSTNLSTNASSGPKNRTPATTKRVAKKQKVQNNEKDISLSQSDGEESLDSFTETESMKNFVDDNPDENEDNSGMEQRATENSGAFQSDTNGKKRLNFDTANDDKKKRTRSEQREIGVTQERGRGDTRRDVLEYNDITPFFLPCSDFITPWDKQQERKIIAVGHERGKLQEGAFGIEAHARWMNSDEQQTRFAEAFSIPYDETSFLKKVSSDVEGTPLNPTMLLSNATTKILHCLRTTNPPTELDFMNSKHYDEVFLGLHRTSRALRQEMDGGPNGGLQSCAVDVLWNIYHGDETSNISASMLRLVEILTMAKQGSRGDELFHIVSTERVEWFTKGRNGLTKVQCGVRTARDYNFHEATKKGSRCAVQDIDPRLLRKIWTFRNRDAENLDFDAVSNHFIDLSSLVHDRHQTNNPDLTGMEIKPERQTATDPNPLKMFLYKDVLPVWDETLNQTTTVTIEAIYLMATSPANDPLVFLKSIAENNPGASILLASTLSHMNNVLQQQQCSWDQFFNTDRAGAAEITPESRMLEGLFRFCDTQKLRNVNIGGFRMDVRNKAEMKIWKDYVGPLVTARAAHYRMVIKETLHDRFHQREAQLPVPENPKWTDFYHGHMYWKVKIAHVEKEIAEYASMWEDEAERIDVLERLNDWKNSHISSRDGLSIFVPEGEGFARNSGLWIKIKTNNSKTHEEEIRDTALKKSRDEDMLQPQWAQPQQQCRLIKIWLANAKDRVLGVDPFDFMLFRSKWIPDIEWMHTVLPFFDEQNDNMDWLKEMIGDYITSSKKDFGSQNVRLSEIMQLVGKERNSVHKGIANLEETCRVELFWRTRMQKINASIKNALVQMHTSELLQWRLAAMNIDDLKKQNKLVDKWLEDYDNMHMIKQNQQKSDDWCELLTSATSSSLFFNSSMSRLDADISFMNQMFMWLFICCSMAHNECRRGAYGMTMRVMDMAGTVDVLKEIDKKGSNDKSTMVVKITEKSPGAGADTTISFVMQMLVSAMSHISLTREVKELASTAVDTIHKNVSKMSYALLQGSGVMVNAKNEIMSNSKSFQTELSNNAHFTELFKNDEDPSMLAWLESLMAHSGDVQVGAESGVKQAAWTTTMALESWNVLRLKPMPVIVLTGNRPAIGTPASAVEGGRWMCCASSTQDKENGFYKISHKPLVGAMMQQATTNTHRSLQSQISSRALLANSQSTCDIRRDIKVITREDVLSNMMHFLLMQWLRKDTALLLSTLTHEARGYCYSMKCTYSRMECCVGQLTKGMKRDYLDKNAQYWHRNAMGPWNKVLQVSMHVYLTMSTTLLNTLARTRDGWPLDLHWGFMQGIRALMTNTIGIMAMLSSLQLWLSSVVLDYNTMILCCYIYHFTSFQTTCPLRVLSLVLLGHKLSNEDQEKYLLFCEHLAPCVLQHHVQGVRTDNGPRNVRSGTLQMPNMKVLGDWYSHHLQPLQNDIRTSLAARLQGDDQEKFSVFCQPRMGFVQTDTIKGFGIPKQGVQGTSDPNVSGTARRVLATALGHAQRPVEHMRRMEKGACIDGSTNEILHGRHQKKKLADHENTVEFWNNVRKGTLLPECSTSTNDIFKVKFEFTPYTGIWWDNSMNNAGQCDGILKHFLLQSDLDLEISHYEFFTALMGPYFEFKGIHDTVYGGPDAPGVHKNAWNIPVLEKLNVFEFSSNPHIDHLNQLEGVYVNICMRLVHYVLMQGLGITNDWDKTAHDDSDFVSCTHLRNMSHMTLGILSLLLHTSCEKAMIPCNNGHLRLPLPSPDFESKTESFVQYDSRLHIDTHYHLMAGSSDNMLSIDSRLALNSNWTVINFPSGSSALIYNSVLEAAPQLHNIISISHLLPFPPESMAHISCMYQEMFIANKRTVDQALKNPDFDFVSSENLFAFAMLQLSNSIRFEDVQHIQPSLTNCVMQDVREIPCVTFEHSFLFILTFEKAKLILQPVSPTHAWNRVQNLTNDGFHVFQKPPMPTKTVLDSCDFFKLFHHGLKVLDTTENFQVVVDIQYSQEKRLPFYMFPVVHFPVLVLMQHEGWTMPMPDIYEKFIGSDLFLDTSEIFLKEHIGIFHFRQIDSETEKTWLETNCPHLLALNSRPELSDTQAYFLSSDTTNALGVWVRFNGMRMHFDSLHHLMTSMDKGIDVSLFVQNTQIVGEHYMLHHKQWGLASVRYRCSDQKSSSNMVASFSYFYDKSEDINFINTLKDKLATATLELNNFAIQELEEEIAERLRELESQPELREAFRDIQVSKDFNEFVANIMPLGEGTKQTNASWGLVVEANGAFLCNGCYTVSALLEQPNQQFKSQTYQMDFITMSRCMLAEGSELWIKINKSTYNLVLKQAEEKGLRLMLPVTSTLHENFPDQPCCYLRSFYVLGGSVHDKPVELNSVNVVCVIASKRSVPGKSSSVDDHATIGSRVNQNISAENTRFVAISLPIFSNEFSPIFDYSRDSALPIYKYLKHR